MIERAGEAAGLPFPVHVHVLRHSIGYALAGRGMDTRRLQHYLGHASITNTLRYTAMSPRHSRIFGVDRIGRLADSNNGSTEARRLRQDLASVPVTAARRK
jgi:integrase